MTGTGGGVRSWSLGLRWPGGTPPLLLGASRAGPGGPTLKARFPIERGVVVGDRGLLSEDHLEVPSEAGLDHIVAPPLPRRSSVTRRVIEAVEERLEEQLKP
jgi:hypothetical protein